METDLFNDDAPVIDRSAMESEPPDEELPPPDEPETDEAPIRRRSGRPPKRPRRDVEVPGSSSDAEPERPRRRGRPAGARGPGRPRKAVAVEIVIPEHDPTTVQQELVSSLAILSLPLSVVLPVTAVTIQKRAEVAVSSAWALSAQNPRLRVLMIRLSQAGAWQGLITAGASVVAAVGVDIRALPPQAMPVQLLIGDVLKEFAEPEPSPPSNVSRETSVVELPRAEAPPA